MIEVGSDFSGVGAFDQALRKLGIDYKTVFSCDMDLYARETYMANYGEPMYYPFDVYERNIPKKSLDIYMTSPPCQAFSLAGKRLGENDKRGILFYNSHEFIKENKPRYFIFENVKGLLSDNKKSSKDKIGQTFQNWLTLLGGKSTNGVPIIFPHEDSVPYHIYWKVLNAKHYGVPQNRERVFIIGIRDDQGNVFSWPKEIPLVKRLKDVLEENVDPKYYLSDKMIQCFTKHKDRHDSKGNGFGFKPKEDLDTYVNSVTTCSGSRATDNFIKIKSATKQGFEIAEEGDSINFSQPNSETRRARVGKEVAQTLDTACNQGVLIGAIRGRGEDNTQTLELNGFETSNSITTVQKDNMGVQLNQSKESGGQQPYKQNRVYDSEYLSPALDTECGRPGVKIDYNIRRLTPRECFRLMDFSEDFVMPCSDTQMYKQAGNSIVVNVLAQIINKLKL